MFATHLCANVVAILSWRTGLPGWITHHFGVVQFLYRLYYIKDYISCCDESIESMYTTLTYVVFSMVTNKDVILMKLLTVLGHIGLMT
jgi:hypothetical protein